MNTRTAVVSAFVVTILGGFYFLSSSSSISPKMTPSPPPASTNGIPGIEFQLSQISRSPPSILVTLKNHNPKSTFTLLKWSTPLDPLAQILGVFKLEDADTGEKVPIDVIMINRKTPPPRDELVTIMPGTEESVEVVFNKPWFPEKKPAKYKVKAEGTFKGAWEKSADQVTDNELDVYVDSPLYDRAFETKELLMTVH
ncbi:hypothetical protein B0J11DRAFT_427771 [Dendryphion nanum]|uniref:Uncharacterized protein n=1 Tax=Dendryphion nanum TaxID=256645 RepID=A0A9P9E8J0_9PLEO|nr:hypothetical protein B0J11DRAFT_427771 [Dendryphion nanum]